MTEDEMSGWEELLEKLRREALALQGRIEAIEELGSSSSSDCAEISTSEMCEQFSAWADELTLWLMMLANDVYEDPATVDPPPKPPFRS